MRLRRFAPKLHRSVFVGFDPIIESEVPEKKIPLGRHGPTLMDAKLS